MLVSNNSFYENLKGIKTEFLYDIYSNLSDSDLAAIKKISRFFNDTISDYRSLFIRRTLCRVQNRAIEPSDLKVLWNKDESSFLKPTDQVKVAILTCRGLKEYKCDDRGVIDAFKQLGVLAEHVTWNSDPQPNWGQYKAALVRSTWDYSQPGQTKKFLEVLSTIEKSNVVLFNSLQIIKMNSDKRYLQLFSARGVPCIETEWVSRTSLDEVPLIMQKKGWAECVIKPSISGGGANTHRITSTKLDAFIVGCKAVAVAEWMLQPFVKSVVTEGEYSVLIIGGRAFKVVKQSPKEGNFLVQFLHGGKVTRFQTPPKDVMESGQEIFNLICEKVPESGFKDSLIVRIDIVRGSDGKFILGEAEAIEPYTFSYRSEIFGRRVASVVLDRLFHMKRIFAWNISGQLARFQNHVTALLPALAYKPVENAASAQVLRTISKTTSMTSVVPYPESIAYETVMVSYRDEEEQKQAIAVIAETLSSIYASFLTLEYHQKRSKDLEFVGMPTHFPEQKVVALFRAKLKEIIVFKLNFREQFHPPYLSQIYLSTGYRPEGYLNDVLVESGINPYHYILERYFPKLTSTIVTRRSDRKTILVETSNQLFFKKL
jgi:glutathione synthase/RimK-type ligase-like ATP-grasp enzyme